MNDDQMKALREAVEDGHLRVSVSVGVGSPVATIGTRELLELVHAGERVLKHARRAVSCKGTGAMRAEGEPPPNSNTGKVSA